MERLTRINVPETGFKKTFLVNIREVHLQLGFKIKLLNYGLTYKKWIASVLLALYSFICLPASAWHSHTQTADGQAWAGDKATGIALCKANTESGDGICKICAHHYSLYCNDVFVPETSCLVFSKPDNTYGHKLLPDIPVYRFLNRGPPAVS